MTWDESDLATLLRRSLAVVNTATLAAWCDPEARLALPDDRLLGAAAGNPRQLIKLGNQLLAQVAGHPQEPAVAAGDLNAVLGPPAE